MATWDFIKPCRWQSKVGLVQPDTEKFLRLSFLIVPPDDYYSRQLISTIVKLLFVNSLLGEISYQSFLRGWGFLAVLVTAFENSMGRRFRFDTSES